MRVLRYAGPVAALWAWVVILLSSLANPTFSVLHSPLSAMGSPGATDPWIYNVGMMTVGTLILLFGLSLGTVVRHWVQGFASGLVGTAGIFLALVGIYHGGTTPHDFVSLWFFLQAALGSTAWGVGALLAGSRQGLVFILLGLGAPIVAQFVPWPSNGLEECFGALVIDAFAILTFWEYHRRSAVRPKTPPGVPHPP